MNAVSRVQPISYASRFNGGYTEIDLKNEPSLRVMDTEGRDWRPLFDEISSYFAKADRDRLAISSWPSFASLIVLLFPYLAIVLLGSSFRQPSTIDMIVVSPNALRLRRRWLGSVSRSETLPLKDVTKVRIMRQSVPTLTKWDSATPGAIIYLVGEDGEATAINRDLLPGVEVHDRAAEALRGALEIREPVEVLDDQ